MCNVSLFSLLPDTQKENFGRRLRKLRSSIAKTQAESALAIFELKEENSRLAEENLRLLGKDIAHL